MNDTGMVQNVAEPAASSQKMSLLWQKLPYLIVLVLAIVGVAYTSVSHRPISGYWEFLALATGVACVVTGWRKAEDKQASRRIAWTQILHWGAFLVAMNTWRGWFVIRAAMRQRLSLRNSKSKTSLGKRRNWEK